jgi:hypothetical protein
MNEDKHLAKKIQGYLRCSRGDELKGPDPIKGKQPVEFFTANE